MQITKNPELDGRVGRVKLVLGPPDLSQIRVLTCENTHMDLWALFVTRSMLSVTGQSSTCTTAFREDTLVEWCSATRCPVYVPSQCFPQ
jgi:hypothetical protein